MNVYVIMVIQGLIYYLVGFFIGWVFRRRYHTWGLPVERKITKEFNTFWKLDQ